MFLFTFCCCHFPQLYLFYSFICQIIFQLDMHLCLAQLICNAIVNSDLYAQCRLLHCTRCELVNHVFGSLVIKIRLCHGT